MRKDSHMSRFRSQFTIANVVPARWARGLLLLGFGILLFPPVASAATTFNYTGAEQTYTVPTGVSSIYVTATGARGGGPTTGFGTGGRGARVTGTIHVTPGRTVYVEVGGIGGQPDGGFNGGGASGVRNGGSLWGGGGASDVRRVARGDGGSLDSRLIVAGGGGGGAYPGGVGGDAGMNGLSCCDFVPFPTLIPAPGGKAGMQDAGGHGGCVDGGFGCGDGCSDPLVSCGHNGDVELGGDGGAVGDAETARVGAGGGGGLYGGGGGAAVAIDATATGGGSVGGGGGGSSKVPPDGVQLLGTHTDAASVVISTKPPKYLALQIPLYLCFNGTLPQGTHYADLSYIDKGNNDRHLEMTQLMPVPEAANGTFTAGIGGQQFATVTADSTGFIAQLDLTGSVVPAVAGGNANVEVRFGNLVVASSYCGP